MVKEKGPPESSVFTMFKRQIANTKLVVSDKNNDLVTSSRVSIISKNPQADTTPNISVSRFINGVTGPPPLETFTSEIFIGFQTAVAPVFLNSPQGLAVDGSGNLLIAENGNHRVRRVDAVTGIITTVAGTGSPGYNGDNRAATGANLRNPIGVAVGASGNLLIADNGNRRIRRVHATTGIITTVAGTGVAGYNGDNIDATGANLNNPRGLAVDGSGNLLIGDASNNRVRRVDAVTGIITTVAGTGATGYNGDDIGATGANLFNPSGVVVGASGNLLISDASNNRIRRVHATTGIITTVAGTGSTGYNGDSINATGANLFNPSGVVVDGNGNLLIADVDNHRVRRVDAVTGIITTVAGTGVAAFSGDGGSATGANLNQPSGLVVGASGSLLVSDATNNRIRRVDAVTGIITTVAGGGYAIGISNIYVSVSFPRGVVVRGDKVYVTDTARRNIYVLDKNTGAVSATYGTGISGTTATAGRLQFAEPYRIALDSSGNIFVADAVNDNVRRINFPAGDTTNIASGNRPNGVAVYNNIVYYADTGTNRILKVPGGVVAGTYSAPEGLAVDSGGNLYVANSGLNKITKVTPGNVASDIGLPAGITLNYPRSVAVDSTGRIYIADGGNNRVIRLNTDGTVTLVATGLNIPMDVSVDTDGTVYIADFGNNRILKIRVTFV